MDNYIDLNYVIRMKNSSGSKQDVLRPLLTRDMSLLDYGSGPSSFIYDLCCEFGVEYTALDISSYVQQELEKKSIQCISELKNISDEKYDLVFLSSVYHEFISYLSPIDVASKLREIYRCLKPNGLIVFRDWYTISDNDYISMSFVDDCLDDSLQWVEKLKENNIINDKVYINKNDFKMTTPDAYEFIFHVCFGINSIQRESKERYHFEPKDWQYIENNLCMSLKLYETYYDASYSNFINTYVSNINKKTIAETMGTNFLPSKEVRIYRKN